MMIIIYSAILLWKCGLHFGTIWVSNFVLMNFSRVQLHFPYNLVVCNIYQRNKKLTSESLDIGGRGIIGRYILQIKNWSMTICSEIIGYVSQCLVKIFQCTELLHIWAYYVCRCVMYQNEECDWVKKMAPEWSSWFWETGQGEIKSLSWDLLPVQS